ncbi:MAG: V-type ATP synthase subunit F [Clostridia bacterium]|nr:V-type ATP synthase subunit F [Clostridia bacterium]
MNNSNKTIAVIGKAALVKVFRAIGYDCFYDTAPDAVIARCQALDTAGYKIILILEKTAAQIGKYLDSRAGKPYPIIMPIPDTMTPRHYGMERLKANMEKAMGIKVGGNV